MKTIRQVVFTSFSGRYMVLVINFGSTMVLARLLTPADIGIYSVAAVLVAVAHVLRDFGVGQYLIQERELNNDRIRAAFTVSLMIAWTLAVVMYLSADLVSDFYDEPGIAKILKLLCINFLLIPFGSITRSYLTREMNFSAILRIDVSSAVIQAIIGISAALLGQAYMALAWSSLAGIVWVVFMTSFYRPKGFPLLPGFKDIKRVLSFGSMAGATGILKTVGKGSPELILGRVLDMTAVGLFSRGQAVIQIFQKLVMQGLAPVIMPYFSKEHRDGQQLKGSYMHVVACITGIAWSFFLFVALLAYPVIGLLYGDQWYAAVPVVQLLCAYAAINMLTAVAENVLISVGQVSKVLRLNLIQQPIYILIILYTAQDGIVAVAQALLVVPVLRFIVVQQLLKRNLGVKFFEYTKIILQSGFVALLASLPPVALLWLNGSLLFDNAFLLLANAFFSAMLWCLGVFVLNHPIKKELNLVFGVFLSKIGMAGTPK